ncbi:hypothetical protein WJX81_000275 [Elliptochloris bilobata]|uniref:AB hydrolase-1 domain-containing protein n=1 Tax=Elliptochloris bilobata TaxID=381761 RepID=A0AAW1RIM3_9CHLO
MAHLTRAGAPQCEIARPSCVPCQAVLRAQRPQQVQYRRAPFQHTPGWMAANERGAARGSEFKRTWPARHIQVAAAKSSANGSVSEADLPKVGLGAIVGGHLRWALLIALAVPIWAYQGALGLLAAIFARDQFFARKDRSGIEYPDPPQFEHRFIQANGLRFHTVVTGGGRGKPLMLFLHGFPELWYSWRRQLEELADDYECVAIDMRGYNLSDKPKGRENYRIDVMTDDIAALVEALGHKRCTLVAHDWGGTIAWFFAALHPQAVERLIVCGLPHPIATLENFGVRQWRRSWYILWYQAPFLPEWLSLAADCSFIDRALRTGPHAPRRPGTISDEDLERYKQALTRPGAMTASLEYYRSLVDRETRAPAPRYLEAKRRLRAGLLPMPVLMLYGGQDAALGPELVNGTEKYVPDLELHVLDCSHWVQQECWEDTNALMRAWLAKHPAGGRASVKAASA